MPWKELVRIALLGSDRTELPDALRQTMQALNINVSFDSAKAILQAAAKLQAKKKAGYKPTFWHKEWPNSPKDTTERFCSVVATRHLQMIMEGTHTRSLSEFFQLAKKEGLFLPPEQVPQLLEQAIEQPAQLAVLQPLLGSQARWLMAQHPEWSQLFDEPNSSEWATSNFQQQLHIFRQLRKSDLLDSVLLLQSSWGKLDVKQKIAFLSAMKDTVCLADEVLLEPALDDPRKEVRQQAAHLLGMIPGSALLQRTWERLDPLIQIKVKAISKDKPMITLPEEVTEAMLRDGLDPQQQWLRGGLKASRLAQMMAIIPPIYWENKFKKTPGELLTIFVRSEYAILLLQALSHAAALHRNDDWTIALLHFWLEHHQQDRWEKFNPKVLYDNLTATAFNAIALPALQQCENLPDERDPISLLIRKNTQAWSDNLTIEFIAKCKEWISQNSSSYWTAFQLRNIIQNAAYHINPDLADSLTKSWPVSSSAWGSWEKDIEQFFKTLRFRKTMRAALCEK